MTIVWLSTAITLIIRMGIIKLADLIRSDAPRSISYKEIGDYNGKKIALDTSIVVNQFRSAVSNPKLCLLGLFYRTLTFLEHDIKPVFVFDGVPPVHKRAVLEKRAQNAGFKLSHHPNTASTKNLEISRLLDLLGVPCVTAPADAEAFCAHLAQSGVVDAVASEDMDTLAFGGTVLLRQLNAKKQSEVTEYSLPKLLETLQLTQKEFVDLCILLGCDYCEKITGLGPSRALKLIQEHRTIEDVVLNINRKTHPVPFAWQYKAARHLFLETPQFDPPQLEWKEPDEEQLVHFLCQEKHLNSTTIIKFADDTVVVGLISNNDERAYLEEITCLETWCQDNNLLLNVSKTKELIVDYSRKQTRSYHPVRINGAAVERVDSFKYLGVHIAQDLSWSCHINTLAKKARQRLYHLRRLRDFRLPSKVLRNFYSCTVESILTGNIVTWFGNSTQLDRRSLQRVVRSAERTIRVALPDLQTIYRKRCWSKAKRIVKDLSHPNNKLFTLLPSGRRFRSLRANTERMRRSFFPMAIRTLNQD